MINLKILYFILVMISTLSINADNKKLPVPRFVSIKSNEVNARSGPTTKSSIEWVFVRKGEPVEIIAEHEQWRKIRDISGAEGWIHSSVLSGKRSVIIIDSEAGFTKAPNLNSRVIAKLMPQVRCILKKCKKDFCQIQCKDYKGWLPKKAMWGVYNNDNQY